MISKEQVLRLAHQTLIKVEWLNTHATARNSKDNKKLEFALSDLRKWMLKIIDTYTSDEVPTEPEYKHIAYAMSGEEEEAHHNQSQTSGTTSAPLPQCEESHSPTDASQS